MLRWYSLAAVSSALLLACTPAPAAAETDLGVLAALLAGTHVGEGNTSSGVVPGGLLEVTQRWDRLRLHLEGIPQVGATSSNTSTFGHSSATLAILNSTVLCDLDRQHRFRVGAGLQVIDLRSFNADDGDTDESRITTPIYALGATLPLAHDRFIEVNVMVDPNVRGVLHIFPPSAPAEPGEPEAGAEVDYSAAFGWRRGSVSYLVGGRGLSYHTRNVNTGALVDRNVGGGATFEVRFALGRT
jgi:hypothetical protein